MLGEHAQWEEKRASSHKKAGRHAPIIVCGVLGSLRGHLEQDPHQGLQQHPPCQAKLVFNSDTCGSSRNSSVPVLIGFCTSLP